MKATTRIKTTNAISLRFLALCGIVGPFIYASVVGVLGALYPGYSHMSQTMSELGAANAPHALVMNIAGLGLLGLMIIAFAAGLHQGIKDGRSASIGTLLIAVSGASLVMTAAFPCDPRGAEASITGLVHGAFATTGAVCLVIGLLVISPMMARDNLWRGYATFSIAAAILASVLASLYGFDVFEGWKGAMQRISMGVALVWIVVMAFRLLRLPH